MNALEIAEIAENWVDQRLNNFIKKLCELYDFSEDELMQLKKYSNEDFMVDDVEEKVVDDVEEKVEEKVVEKVVDDVEEKVEEKVDEKVVDDVEEKVVDDVEEKVVEKVDEKVVEKDLKKMKKKELQEICRNLKVAVSGKKSDLVHRILEVRKQPKLFKKISPTVEDSPRSTVEDGGPKVTVEDGPRRVTGLKKSKNNPECRIEVGKSESGNYTYDGLVIDKHTKKVVGIEKSDGSVGALDKNSIEKCYQYKLDFDMPENLDINLPGRGDDEGSDDDTGVEMEVADGGEDEVVAQDDEVEIEVEEDEEIEVEEEEIEYVYE